MNRLTAYILWFLALLTGFLAIWGHHGYLHFASLQEEVGLLDSRNRELQSEIIERKNRIHGLQTSKFEIERVAREQLGLSKPDEVVYVFDHSEQD